MTTTHASSFNVLPFPKKAPKRAGKIVRTHPGLHVLEAWYQEALSLESSYSQVQRVLHQIEKTSFRDDLTGCLRRSAWERVVTSRGLKQEASPLSCIVLDVDHFKKINDQYGHPVGDLVLKQVAAVLLGLESELVTVSRFGGEEFLVAIQAGVQEATKLAEHIRISVGNLRGVVPHTGESWSVTLSLGVKEMEKPRGATEKQFLDSLEKTIAMADRAMYHSKASGRNQVSIS